MTQTVNYIFDANQHAPDAGMDAIPAGTYSVAIDSAEIKDMNDKDSGQKFVLGFVVIDGPAKGRKVFNNYNLWHTTSPKTVEIAHAQLSAVCHVTQCLRVDFNDAGAALKGAQLRIRVDNDGKYNSVKEVFDITGNKPGRAGMGAAPATTAPVAIATPIAAAPVAAAFPPVAAVAAAPAAFPPVAAIAPVAAAAPIAVAQPAAVAAPIPAALAPVVAPAPVATAPVAATAPWAAS